MEKEKEKLEKKQKGNKIEKSMEKRWGIFWKTYERSWSKTS